MKALLILILICGFINCSGGTKQGTGLIIAGGTVSTTDVEVFPANATCTIPPFPSPGRVAHSLSVINNTLVVCGGAYTETRKSCISWKKGQDSWEDFHTLDQERWNHAAVVGEDQILILGGRGTTTGEIVKSGTQFALKSAGSSTCAVSYQGGFVMIGGYPLHGKVDRYDFEGNQIDSLPDLLEARYIHACTTFTSSRGEEGLLVTGGLSRGVTLSSTELYLPSRNQWTKGGDLPRALSALTAAGLIVTGGEAIGGKVRDEVLQYEEIAGTWSEIGKTERPRKNHGVVEFKASLLCSVDCKVEDWSSWSDCSATCGVGTKTRGRGVVQEAENGGAVCPALEEEESCNTDQCSGTTDANSNNDNGDNSSTTLTASWFAFAVFFTLFC